MSCTFGKHAGDPGTAGGVPGRETLLSVYCHTSVPQFSRPAGADEAASDVTAGISLVSALADLKQALPPGDLLLFCEGP